MLEQSILGRLYAVERTQAGVSLEEQQPKGKTHVEAAHEREGPPAGPGKECKDEGAAETVLWTDHSSHSLAPCATWQGRR